MRSFVARLAAGAVLCGCVSPAWSIMITSGGLSGTDVGVLDGFLGAGRLPSREADELAFLNSVTGAGFTALEKVCGEPGLPSCVSYMNPTDHGSLTFAFEANSHDAYFLVKTGLGSNLTGALSGFECGSRIGRYACTSFVFANLDNNGWAVVDFFNQLGFQDNNVSVSKVTHLARASGPIKTVPEPDALLLLGAGLLGLGLIGRKAM